MQCKAFTLLRDVLLTHLMRVFRMIWVAKTEGKDLWPVLFRNYIFAEKKKNVIFLNRVSIKLLLWGFYLLVSRLTKGHIIKKDNTLPLWPIVFDYCMTLWNYAKTFFSYSFATRSYISIWIHKGWGTLLTYYSDFILDVLCSPV